MFVVFVMLLSAAVAFAGPLTGVPTISYTDESGTTLGAEKLSGFGVGVGYSTFAYKLTLPAGLGGATFDTTVSGPMISGEYYKLIGDQGKAVSFGGWWASVDSGNADLGNLYGRYRFNKNWGLELGLMLADAKKLWGEMSGYVTYEPTLDPKSNLGLQFGLGSMSESKDWMDITGVTVKTKYSAYGTGTMALKNNWTASLGMWLLSQEYDGGAFGKLGDSTTFQWTLGVGKKY